MKISIIIPCFNEHKTISVILDKVKNLLNFEKEIIIVDDFSNDGTREILKKIKSDNGVKIIFNEKNCGKGYCIKEGIKVSSGDIVIIQDADLEYDPFDYNKLLLPFFETNADVVYGSRFLGGGKYVRIHFFWHYLANKILTLICNLFTNLNLTDMETGYKVFKTENLKKIKIEEKTFSFEPEVTIKLAKNKSKFFEVPITYNGRSYEEGKKIGWKDGVRAIWCILKIQSIR
jgi:glycosyltransferase involved in cell wall biosynthesis